MGVYNWGNNLSFQCKEFWKSASFKTCKWRYSILLHSAYFGSYMSSWLPVRDQARSECQPISPWLWLTPFLALLSKVMPTAEFTTLILPSFDWKGSDITSLDSPTETLVYVTWKHFSSTDTNRYKETGQRSWDQVQSLIHRLTSRAPASGFVSWLHAGGLVLGQGQLCINYYRETKTFGGNPMIEEALSGDLFVWCVS